MLTVRRVHLMKTRSVALQGIDPVQNDHVQMHVKVQRTAKALNEGHHTGSRARRTSQSRALNQTGLMARVITARQRLSASGRLAKSRRKGQGKLKTHWPYRDVRNDMVHEVCGGLDHPPCPTGWAEATALAGKSNQMLVTAAIALDSNEAVFKAPAAQVAMELVDDEGGQRRVVSGQFVGKRREVLVNNCSCEKTRTWGE